MNQLIRTLMLALIAYSLVACDGGGGGKKADARDDIVEIDDGGDEKKQGEEPETPDTSLEAGETGLWVRLRDLSSDTRCLPRVPCDTVYNTQYQTNFVNLATGESVIADNDDAPWSANADEKFYSAEIREAEVQDGTTYIYGELVPNLVTKTLIMVKENGERLVAAIDVTGRYERFTSITVAEENGVLYLLVWDDRRDLWTYDSVRGAQLVAEGVAERHYANPVDESPSWSSMAVADGVLAFGMTSETLSPHGYRIVTHRVVVLDIERGTLEDFPFDYEVYQLALVREPAAGEGAPDVLPLPTVELTQSEAPVEEIPADDEPADDGSEPSADPLDDAISFEDYLEMLNGDRGA